MNVDFTQGHLTIVVSPVDLRAGYRRLSLIARTLLGIAVEDGGHFVAFVSRDRALCNDNVLRHTGQRSTGPSALCSSLTIWEKKMGVVSSSQLRK